jgi:hypothetical protein
MNQINLVHTPLDFVKFRLNIVTRGLKAGKVHCSLAHVSVKTTSKNHLLGNGSVNTAQKSE